MIDFPLRLQRCAWERSALKPQDGKSTKRARNMQSPRSWTMETARLLTLGKSPKEVAWALL
jgi:hypothetical protein